MKHITEKLEALNECKFNAFNVLLDAETFVNVGESYN